MPGVANSALTGSTSSRLKAQAVAQTGSAGQVALSADSLPGDYDAGNNFVDSIGMNTKYNVSGNVYNSNTGAVKAALLNLGVRHIRDSFSVANVNNYENILNDLGNNGIHSDLALEMTPDSKNNAALNVSATQAVAYLRTGHFANSIEAIEGVNEPDINQTNPGGPAPTGWVSLTQSTQQSLFTGVKALANPIPVYGPSVGLNSDLQAVGDLSQYMDYGNIHDYSGGYDLLGTQIANYVTMEQTLSGSKPIIATENGYATGTTGQGMPNLVMLDYTQRLFFNQFANNVKRTNWYEFLDENNTANDYWHNAGLLTSTYTAKPAYTGLKNIIALLKDQTTYKPRTSLNYSFGGQTQFENLDTLLLQKNDGSFWLVAWQDVSEWTPANNGSFGSSPNPMPTAVPNSLNFLGTYVSSITQYTEDNTGAMTSAAVPVSAGSTAQVLVGPRPIIFKIVPGVAPVVPVAPTISSPTAHWALDEGTGTTSVDSVNPIGNLAVPIGTKSSWVTGGYNSGLSFNGTEATATGNFLDTTQSYSATAWVQFNNLTGYQAAVAVNGVNQSAFAIGIAPGSNISYSVYSVDSAAATTTRIGSTIVPVIGKWYPVAVTYDSATRLMSLYINGTLQNTGTAKAVFDAGTGLSLGSMRQGGISGFWQFMNGGVDEVNLYQRTLTAAEVATMAGM